MRANFKSQYLLVSERNALFKLLNGESYRLCQRWDASQNGAARTSLFAAAWVQAGRCWHLHQLPAPPPPPHHRAGSWIFYLLILSYLISSSPGAGGGGAKEEAGALPLPPLSHLRVHISWFKGEIPGHFEVLETKFSIYISMLERSLSKDTWQVFSSPKYFDKNIIRWIAIV